MTGLLSEIQADDTYNLHLCKVGQILRHLEPKDQKDLETALAGEYTASAIVRVLKRRSLDISLSVVTKHRRKECACVSR